MKTLLGWVLGLVILGGIATGAVFLYLRGKAERDQEAEREKPIDPPSKLSRTKEGEFVLEFSPEEREKLGFKTEAAGEKVEPQEIVSYGRVLSPAPLLALEADLASAQVAAGASKADFERVEKLFQENANASKRALETAQAQFRTDQNRMRSLTRQLASEWGDVLASLSPEQHETLIDKLARREVALIRVSLTPGTLLAGKPGGARVLVLGDESHARTTTAVFDAPQTDPKSQGRSFLLRLENPGPELGAGSAVTAYLETGKDAQKGVRLPNSSILRFAGKTWVYVLLDERHVGRREVSLDRPVDGGWFSTSGVKPGSLIVTQGPQSLLSEEQKGQIHVGD